MLRKFTLAAMSGLLLSGTALAEPVFNRVSSFPVNTNLPAGVDQKTETSAEIISASRDGMTLVYTDSPAKRIGFIDIADPKSPKAAGGIEMGGEPTSVSVSGDYALVGVNTSESYVKPSGKFVAVEIATRNVKESCDLGGQPDSVAISPDGSLAAVAVENERDEELNDGEMPQMPAGYVTIFKLKGGLPDCASMIKADVTGLATIAPEDPEPEFVDFNSRNEIAVTLQENNHIVILGADGKVLSHFTAGSVDIEGIDTKSDGALNFTSSKKAVAREPDAIQWLDDDRVVVANEGDYKGGARSFTIFSRNGEVLYDSGPSLEMRIAALGHYPEKRSKSKGVELEGLEVRKFGDANYIFVLSERSSVVGVYKDTGAAPEFVQVLPTGIAPEGAVAIADRNLLAVANEADLVEDGGVRSHVTLYELGEGEVRYPMIEASLDDAGKPIGWGALSGLAADPDKPGILYAINDSFYSAQPTIFTIDATSKPARIVSALRVTRNGEAAQKMDMEGIALDGKGGFWIANEGNSAKMVPHGIMRVDAKGEITAEIGMPDTLLAGQTRFGFEGIALVGEGDEATLWMAVQREWGDDEKGFVKLVAYNLKKKSWGAVSYPLNGAEKGWVGLSEIGVHGEYAYIIERDNQIGEKAKIKKLYRVKLSDLVPAELGGKLPVVAKEEVHDFLPDLKSAGGYVVDKIEGFTVDAAGNGYAVTDNDGVDDSNSETLFFNIGRIE